MKNLIKTAWVYYIASFIIITILYLLRNTDQRVVGVAGHYGFFDISTRILVIVISFFTALHMGYKNIYSKILFPVIVALFAYLILPIIGFIAYDRADSYYLMYYLILGFIFIFFPHITVALLGLGLGVLLRKYT